MFVTSTKTGPLAVSSGHAHKERAEIPGECLISSRALLKDSRTAVFKMLVSRALLSVHARPGL